MFRTGMKFTWIAAVLAAGLALAPVAQAGGYAGNKCVAKKQKELGKYAKGVAKAWKKYPDDSVSRDTDIAKSFAKLDGKWTKEEEKAVKKNATWQRYSGPEQSHVPIQAPGVLTRQNGRRVAVRNTRAKLPANNKAWSSALTPRSVTIAR